MSKINSKDIIFLGEKCLSVNNELNENSIFGISSIKYIVDENLFDRNKVISWLKQTKAYTLPVVSLESFCQLQNGNYWNDFNNVDDFRAIDYLLVMATKCGIIKNNDLNRSLNLRLFDLPDLILLFSNLYNMNKSDQEKYLNKFKKTIFPRMSFEVNRTRIESDKVKRIKR